MSLRMSFVVASALVATSLAMAQTAGSPFPLLDGKTTPLTLKLKDLDSTWRVFHASSSSYENILASAMSGGGGAPVFTKGDTVTVGTDVFLVTYKPDGPNLAAMFSGGGPPKPKPMTGDTVLRLSLLNLHALSAMDGIKVFDLKEQVAENQGDSFAEMLQKASGAASGSDAGQEKPLLKSGTTAPDFTLHDDKGNAVHLASYRGKVVVLDFWSTWCGPCQDSLPKTAKVAAKYSGKDVVFLGVNVWDEQKAFHSWLPEHKSLNSIKFAIDPRKDGQDVATKLYQVTGIPTQYVIDRKGKIVKSLEGDADDESELVSGIKSALAKG